MKKAPDVQNRRAFRQSQNAGGIRVRRDGFEDDQAAFPPDQVTIGSLKMLELVPVAAVGVVLDEGSAAVVRDQQASFHQKLNRFSHGADAYAEGLAHPGLARKLLVEAPLARGDAALNLLCQLKIKRRARQGSGCEGGRHGCARKLIYMTYEFSPKEAAV